MTSEQWQKIKTIFEEACDLPAEQRPAYLDRACREFPELRKYVEELLASHEASGNFLASPDDDFQAVLGDLLETEDDMLGRRIGAYRIEKVIGEGGMGVVYLGIRDDQSFQHQAAIKLLKMGMDTKALLQRFRKERQTLAVLEHPNIARLLDGGSTEEGRPYFLMEYIDGLPIDRYCDEQRLSIKERLLLFRKVSEAVSHAHQNLVIHRDLKPGNILVTADGEPKLLDFGIAKLLRPAHPDATVEITMPGVRFITPAYASPEQIQDKAISTASDVYSLGALLYTLLSGHRPYNFERHSPLEIERVICETTPVRPSAMIARQKTETLPPDSNTAGSPADIGYARQTTAEKLQRQLSGDLDTIILKALNKEPQRRYASIEQFSDDIQRYLNGLPVTARKDTAGYRAAKFIKRHRVGFSAVVIVFLTLLAAIAGISWQAQIAREEALKSRQTLQFVKQMLAAANPLESGEALTVEQLLDKATERIPKELAKQPEIESEIRIILGDAYQNLGYYDKAQDHYQRNLALLRHLYGSNHSRVANAIRALAVVEHYRGNPRQADSLYRSAVARYRDIGETRSGDYATALNDFGTILLDQSKYDSAALIFRESLPIMQKAFGKDHYQIGSVYNNLAYAYDDAGEYQRADSFYQQALSVFRNNYGDEHPEIANTLNNYAFVKLNVGDTLRSLQLHEEALTMWRKLLGSDHPDVGITLYNIAAVTYYQKDYELAAAKMDEVITIFQKNFPEDHPYLGSTHFLMGRILNALEKYSQARNHLERSLAIRTAKLEAGQPQIGAVCLELGKGFFREQRWQEAETYLLQARQIYTENSDGEKAALRTTLQLLGELYEKTGKPGDADRYRKMLAKMND